MRPGGGRAELEPEDTSPGPFPHTQEVQAWGLDGRPGSPPAAPWTVLGNSEPGPSGREEERGLPPLVPDKGSILRHPGPQASPQQCLLWHPLPGGAGPGHALRWHPEIYRPTGVEGSTRVPPAVPSPCGHCHFRHERSWAHVLGFLLTAPCLFPALTPQLLASWFLSSFHGLFMGFPPL